MKRIFKKNSIGKASSPPSTYGEEYLKAIERARSNFGITVPLTIGGSEILGSTGTFYVEFRAGREPQTSDQESPSSPEKEPAESDPS